MTIREVRQHYRTLRDRALAVQPDQGRYIRSLWASWDDALAKFGDDTDIGRPYLDHLTDVIADPALRADDVVEWLDAYPSAITDRLPGGVFTTP